MVRSIERERERAKIIRGLSCNTMAVNLKDFLLNFHQPNLIETGFE